MNQPSRILSLNIRHGGGLRINKLIDWILAKSADILVIPEYQGNPNGEQLKSALNGAGFQVESLVRLGPRANGVLFASKEPFTPTRLTPPEAPHGELLLGTWPSGLNVIASYFPQLEAKRPFFNACQAKAIELARQSFLLIGDINTGRNDVDIEKGGSLFACKKEFDALSKSGGLVDLWRTQYGEDAREWSWRSRKFGFRLDHAFANAAFKDRFKSIKCYYDHEPRETGITDHSALFVDLV